MIKKLAIVALLLALCCYFVVAVTVWRKPSGAVVCNGVEVTVEGSPHAGFIDGREVRRLLVASKCDPQGEQMDDISLMVIEKALLKNPYIEEVACHKTPGGKVCVRVRQRSPILHVMAADGGDYYLDETGKKMPKSQYFADLVVATGHITPQYARANLTMLGRCIKADPFWNNQIQQIYVTSKGEVELVPRVGNHVVLLGQPVGVEQKLQRLRDFYTKGLNKVGWNKYSAVSLKYDNQIICTKK